MIHEGVLPLGRPALKDLFALRAHMEMITIVCVMIPLTTSKKVSRIQTAFPRRLSALKGKGYYSPEKGISETFTKN